MIFLLAKLSKFYLQLPTGLVSVVIVLVGHLMIGIWGVVVLVAFDTAGVFGSQVFHFEPFLHQIDRALWAINKYLLVLGLLHYFILGFHLHTKLGTFFSCSLELLHRISSSRPTGVPILISCSKDLLSANFELLLSLSLFWWTPCNKACALPEVRRPTEPIWLFCFWQTSAKAILVGVLDRLSSIFRKLFEVLESCKFWPHGSFFILSFFYKIFDTDYCLFMPVGVRDRYYNWGPSLIFLFRAIIGLRFRFC